ncbi:MAG: hypothetical protein AAF127_11465 [Pseudomonadota bacterium]
MIRSVIIVCASLALAGCSGPSLSETLADWFGSGEEDGLQGLEPVSEEDVDFTGSEGSFSTEVLRDDLPNGPGSAFETCVANLTIVGEHCGCIVNRASDAGLADADLAVLFTGDGSRTNSDDAARYTRIVRGCANYEVALSNVPSDGPKFESGLAISAEEAAEDGAASAELSASGDANAPQARPSPRANPTRAARQNQPRQQASAQQGPPSATQRPQTRPQPRPQPAPTRAPLPPMAAPAGSDGPLLRPIRPQASPTPPPPQN